jgi:four helix bundle protein
MRRAAVSIAANIAERFRRRGKGDKARFLNMAEGSIEECRYFLILAKDLGYGDTQKLSVALVAGESGKQFTWYPTDWQTT